MPWGEGSVKKAVLWSQTRTSNALDLDTRRTPWKFLPIIFMASRK